MQKIKKHFCNLRNHLCICRNQRWKLINLKLSLGEISGTRQFHQNTTSKSKTIDITFSTSSYICCFFLFRLVHTTYAMLLQPDDNLGAIHSVESACECVCSRSPQCPLVSILSTSQYLICSLVSDLLISICFLTSHLPLEPYPLVSIVATLQFPLTHLLVSTRQYFVFSLVSTPLVSVLPAYYFFIRSLVSVLQYFTHLSVP